MNTKLVKVLVISVVAVLALGVLGLSVAFAQIPSPQNPFTPGGMMGGVWSQQGSSSWMSTMHNRMSYTGGMHSLVWNALAEELGLTTEELTSELNSGKTLADLAEVKGLDRAALVAGLERAHQIGLAQAVTDQFLTQEQADAMLSQMSGRYEWMIDNLGVGAGYGMMGGRGMMGRFFGQQGSNWQYAPGGCHGSFAPAASQNKP